ncbi:replication protein A 70 kDa DNA-binding subunit A-like [Cryptomeria japonica]|uniref:replication protein A 70 kDa DNA-binding subunit A-like n=1 Tax=Cryptomeria japonica TaxID=3369 RepID=UPI0027DA7B61|nr:replication protein A 70 kDa DNA-binding subunit A-like [Cryptomeria japonica]
MDLQTKNICNVSGFGEEEGVESVCETSVLKRCDPDVVALEEKSCYTPINEVINCNNNSLADVICVIVNVGEISIILIKDGTEVKKRIVKINDMSTFTIDVNLWGITLEELGEDLKNMHKYGTFVILSMQNARVGYFNRKVINMTTATIINTNPCIPEAEPLILRGEIPEYLHPHSAGGNQISSQYNRMTIASILEHMSIAPKIIETTITTVLKFINDDHFYYIACPLQINGKECKKKCTRLNDNSWMCPRYQTQVLEYNYKYLLQMKLQDPTNNLWANGFNEFDTKLLGTFAKELYILQYDMTIGKTPRSIIDKVIPMHYTFTLLVSTDTYNFERRLKVIVNKVAKVDFEAQCIDLLAEIARMGAAT